MSWLNPWLLSGLGLVVIPVVLHLLMRQTPKKLLFPALRLLLARRRQNTQRMKIKHLWLLLLRMLAIAAIVFALARPTLPAADYDPSWSDGLRLLGVIGLCVAAAVLLEWFWVRPTKAEFERAHRRTLLTTGLAALAVILFAAVVLWPYGARVVASSKQSAIPVSQNIPVLAVMLLDSSLSMQYQFESKSRLEVAQELATSYVSKLPRLSRVAVGDTAQDEIPRFLSDMSSVQTRIRQVAVRPTSRSLNERLESALQVHSDDREQRRRGSGREGEADLSGFAREVYLFTDMAGSAWQSQASPRLQGLLADLPEVSVYLVDVGVSHPANVALTGMRLNDTTLSVGGETLLRVTLEATGDAVGEKTLELHVVGEEGRLIKQKQTTVSLDEGTQAVAQFTVSGTKGPFCQGVVRLVGTDPLPFDNELAFTVRVEPPPEVLVISSAAEDAKFFLEALAPAELVRRGKVRYRCTWQPPEKLVSEELKKYRTVALLNVAELSAAGWNQLSKYTEEGGGVLVVLGDRVKHAAYLSTAAQSLLPAELLAPLKFSPPEALDVGERVLLHELFKRFVDWGTGGLGQVEIRRYWRVTPHAEGRVICTFTDGRAAPAIVERTHKNGRCVLVTTSFDNSGWNDLYNSDWYILALCDQLVRYAGRQEDYPANFLAGQPARVSLESEPGLSRYLLRKPEQQQVSGQVPANSTMLLFGDLDQLGNYLVLSPEAGSSFEAGFSFNPDPNESRLQTLSAADLDALLGEGRYKLARNLDALERTVQAGRVGIEAAGYVLPLVLLLFLAEAVVGLFFYSERDPAAAAPASARVEATV